MLRYSREQFQKFKGAACKIEKFVQPKGKKSAVTMKKYPTEWKKNSCLLIPSKVNIWNLYGIVYLFII